MSASPAERYAASRRRSLRPRLAEFAAGYPFGLDAFQVEACEALEDGSGVLVAAPTGAGKTVVGEFAVALALAGGTKCFYTTPIKALSNQKFGDLAARFGPDRIGLLTGDVARNGDAPVVVMTTEVLRNMLYAGSPALRGLSHVVMDEVHYLSDRARGGVWEEVIIHLPESVTLVSLSATVSNAEEFGEWLVTVRGDTRVVVSEHRPVPLWQHVLSGARLHDLFVSGEPLPDSGLQLADQVNPALLRLAREDARWGAGRSGGRGGGYGGNGGGKGRPGPPRRFVPDRVEVLERLDRAALLPAIVFVFSRSGCDAAVTSCIRANLRLCAPEDRAEIRRVAETRTAGLADADLRVLGYFDWLDGLERGVAAHHAGLLPAFKETVEELFAAGLIRAVFATETLALGINMPARTVVLERLSKWNGETHADVTPGEYTQLTGRAGRRGIDVEGHAVVLWSAGLDPLALAGLASTRTYPLRSSFRPSYNMAVNLVGSVGTGRARELLEQSFAQFQADRGVVGLARQITRNGEALAGYAEAMTCHLGDVAGYDALRRELKARESYLAREGAAARKAAANAALEGARPGDVLAVASGRRAGIALVLDPGPPAGLEGPRPTVLTEDRQIKRLTAADAPSGVSVVGRVRIPRGFNPRSAQERRDLVATLRAQGFLEAHHGAATGPSRRPRSAAADDPEISRLRAAMRAHPVHGCADRDDHLRWAERAATLAADTDALRRRVAGRTGTLARTFDRVCAVLRERGYLIGQPGAEGVSDQGRMLARVYAETDLLAVECLRSGQWDALDAAELAAVVSALVFEARRPEDGVANQPPRPVRAALAELAATWGRLAEQESAHTLPPTRAPDPGFAWAAHRWASGAGLASVLEGVDLTAGDFVRWCRQLVDLLGQIADVASGTALRATAQTAQAAVLRGVVAA